MSALFLSIKDKISTKRLAVIFILLLLSILVRETGILFLLIIIMYRICYLRKDIKIFLIASTITVMVYFGIRFDIGHVYFAKLELVPIARLSLFGRLINMPAMIFYYLKTFLFPSQLAVAQVWIVQTIKFANFCLPLMIDTLFFFILFLFGRYVFKVNKKYFLIFSFFIMWFILGLGFHMQIFPLDWTVADRWFYFPMVGLLGSFGVVIQSIKLSSKGINIAGYIIAFIILVSLSLRTMVRNTNWSNAITLYSHDIRVSDNFDLENNLGMEYVFVQEYNKAIDHFKRSVEFFPYENNIYNIAYAYELMGNNKEAENYYLKAINAQNYSQIQHKHNLSTYGRLSQILLLNDEPETAKKYLTIALENYPGDGSLWATLAISLYWLGDQHGAINAIEKARTLAPIYPNDSYVRIVNYIYGRILNHEKVDMNF